MLTGAPTREPVDFVLLSYRVSLPGRSANTARQGAVLAPAVGPRGVLSYSSPLGRAGLQFRALGGCELFFASAILKNLSEKYFPHPMPLGGLQDPTEAGGYM